MTVGLRMPMVDGAARVRGTIGYTSNADAPAAAIGRLVRSQHPHARLSSIDVSAAASAPGVLAVLTGADLRRDQRLSPFFGPLVRDQPILAIDIVRYVGEPIVAIAAADDDAAARAADLVAVEYEPLPAMFEATFEAAIGRDGAVEYTIVHGDVDRALADAAVVLEREYSTPRVQHVALEPHAVLARVDADGRIVVESNTQTPHHLRRQLAAIFGVSMARVRVIVNTLGGAFGSKSYPEIEPAAVALARVARRPVKLVLGRDEEFVTTARHATRIHITSGTTREGKLLALRGVCVYDNGAYSETAERVIRNAARALTAAYHVPNVHVHAIGCLTNAVPCGPFRAPGAAQAVWAMESHIDEVAAAVGMDPLSFRHRNVVSSGESYVDSGLLEHICFPVMLDTASRTPTDNADLRRQEVRGRGYAIGMKTTNTPSTSTATVKMNQDGSLDILTSSVEMGQGSTTALAQLAASRAHLPLDAVRVSYPDTDSTPFDHATTSSRTTFAMGTAIMQAVDAVLDDLRRLAAEAFEVAREDIKLADGRASIAGAPDRSMAYAELINRAHRGNLIGHATHVTSAKPDPVTGAPGASAHYHQAVGAADIAVDIETGRVRLLRLHAGVFVGLAINPTLCELQLEGSLVMGAGQSLFEEVVHDGGQIVNPNLADYLIPGLRDLPNTVETRLYEEPDHPDIHGIGEVAAPIAAPAIANAIANAVGVRVRDLPITPEKVLRGIRELQPPPAEVLSSREGGQLS